MISSLATFLWIVLPIFTWIAYKKYYHTITGLVAAFVATLIVGYILYVGTAWMVGKEFGYELSKYDLDGDGGFSNEEYTPEAQAAMKRLTNDTGRSFAPIVAGPVTFIWTSLWFSILSAGSWTVNRFFSGRTQNNKKKAERAGSANPHAFGTFGTAPANSASRAGAVPKASGDT